ncbi:hypothetical protein [Candidatus Aalborgicola defluviihabitans]|uniref:hypothetical protein n=1 Tax=Candidatus Aalborgicola defluviihabitans TaxID=3386187 RepID=UPI001D4ABEEC|nr:hypothetical protein [Burkholderiales bacterium]MBK7282865.1 hypothetical protein [Burkholderiales bacterium]MBK7314574.1 hypothetical protein [Burkholderiales bacterium]MBL0245285.1 hypothetical protein [Rhodoferax sp.]
MQGPPHPSQQRFHLHPCGHQHASPPRAHPAVRHDSCRTGDQINHAGDHSDHALVSWGSRIATRTTPWCGVCPGDLVRDALGVLLQAVKIEESLLPTRTTT